LEATQQWQKGWFPLSSGVNEGLNPFKLKTENPQTQRKVFPKNNDPKEARVEKKKS